MSDTLIGLRQWTVVQVRCPKFVICSVESLQRSESLDVQSWLTNVNKNVEGGNQGGAIKKGKRRGVKVGEQEWRARDALGCRVSAGEGEDLHAEPC
eukprot:748201-Hanusia_phi.AAC.2